MIRKQRVARVVSLRLVAGGLSLGLGLLAACSGSDRGPGFSLPSSFFGGGVTGVEQPALAGASPTAPAGSGGGGSVLPDPCAVVPEGQLALIDDFEDADQDAVPEVDREAYWFPIDDMTKGSIVPEKAFPGGSPGGAHGSAQAAHITASGFTDWGAAFAANISYLHNNLRCPFNARHFSGYRFFARGSGNVFVTLQIPEIIEDQYGGTCRPSAGDVCYDAHGIWITLTPDWKPYSFKWSDFKQRGFGKQAPFNPGTIMSLQFSMEKAQLPVDFWLDDVSFDDGSPFPGNGGTGGGGTGGGGTSGGGTSGGGTGGGGTNAAGASGAADAGSAGQADSAGAGGASGSGQGT